VNCAGAPWSGVGLWVHWWSHGVWLFVAMIGPDVVSDINTWNFYWDYPSRIEEFVRND
jgi:hypothetical protein